MLHHGEVAAPELIRAGASERSVCTEKAARRNGHLPLFPRLCQGMMSVCKVDFVALSGVCCSGAGAGVCSGCRGRGWPLPMHPRERLPWCFCRALKRIDAPALPVGRLRCHCICTLLFPWIRRFCTSSRSCPYTRKRASRVRERPCNLDTGSSYLIYSQLPSAAGVTALAPCSLLHPSARARSSSQAAVLPTAACGAGAPGQPPRSVRAC